MGQSDPDPGGSASLYQYFLVLLSGLGLGRPAWAPWLFGALMATVTLLSLAPILRGAVVVVRQVKGAWDRQRDPRRLRRRALFADHVESQLRRLDEREEWRDHRFARLEAEVETEGGRRFLLPRRLHRRRDDLRREKSLSSALQRSSERLIVLQGEPGSGKSVAMRNAARALAVRAMRRPRLDSRIPLYINLKQLRPVDGRLDAETVRSFVLDQLNRANSRDVEQFLDDEFTSGMRDGTWLFLFDSFDEIPEVLTATELDATVGRYADALYDFLHGMNVSPGVIASREFKGPRRFGWPRFTVQRLTDRQKRELIRKADLAPDAEGQVYAALAGADPMVTRLSGNPMLLGLLCEHVRTTGAFPNSSHAIFETFVRSRLERDRERISKRFSVDPDELRQVAEEIAFCLTAEFGVGLSPSRAQIAGLLHDTVIGGRPVAPARLNRLLDALEYVKLAQAPESGNSGDEVPFTFAHRRFQEYFATCVVIREPDRVPIEALLLDGRWRETAVALLQTQDGDAVTALVASAGRILARGAQTLPTPAEPLAFEWPPNSLHLLDLLDTGLAGRPEDVPASIRASVTTLVDAAWASERRHYQLWAVQATLLAEPSTAETILEESFSSKSMLLRGAAYRYAGRLPEVPAQLSRHLRLALIDQASQGRLLFDWPTVRAQLSRLYEPEPQLRAARLLRWNPVVTGLLVVLTFVAGAIFQGAGPRMGWAAGGSAAVGIIAAIWVAGLLVSRARSRVMPPGNWAAGAFANAGVRLLALFTGLGIALYRESGLPEPPVGHTLWGVLFFVALLYTAFWPAAAVAAVAWGTSTRLLAWPFLTLIVIPAAVMAFVRIGWRQRLKGIMWAVATAVALPLSLQASLWTKDTHPQVTAVITPIVYALAGLVATWATVAYLRHEWADRRGLLAVSRQKVLDADAMRQVIRRLRSDDGLRLLANLVRRQRILCTDDALPVLDETVACAERRRRENESLPFWPRHLSRWRTGWWPSLSTGHLSQQTLDELARLVAERTNSSTTIGRPWPNPTTQRTAAEDSTGVRATPAR
ncbi:NACHT domain-containing protein [Micromonospora zamorensis]|uniref:NACHT domain-containing protein n=1 Tax=Micromonospora zamorensis TaxID=709883 RepID=UPI0033DACE54